MSLTRSLRVLVSLALLGAAVVPIGAQPTRPGILSGRVVDEAGAPLGGAVLRASQGTRTILAYAQDDGDFRLGGLQAGVWTVSVRRLGHRPLAVTLTMPAAGLRRDFYLSPAAVALDPVLVAARWTGVRGIVGDARRLDPLAGASVRVLGSDAAVGSDSLGQFAIALPGGRDVLLRVERAGYRTQIVSTHVPEASYLEIEVGLDTNPQAPRDYWVWRDLDQRLKFATPRAAIVSREELERTDAVSLGDALPLTASVTRVGVQVSRRSCVFVNGVPRPNFPVDAILAGDVEFVEVYPPGTDLTRTLALRWPRGGICGVPEGNVRAADSRDRSQAQFVAVWLRAP